MKKLLPHLWCWCLLLCSTLSIAQNRTITGKVADAKGQPVPYASILIKGTKTGANANEEGTFTLAIPTGKVTLQIKAIGYEDKEVEVGTANNLSISLRNGTAMSEVVVTALV